jgi:hypothetical protein
MVKERKRVFFVIYKAQESLEVEDLETIDTLNSKQDFFAVLGNQCEQFKPDSRDVVKGQLKRSIENSRWA